MRCALTLQTLQTLQMPEPPTPNLVKLAKTRRLSDMQSSKRVNDLECSSAAEMSTPLHSTTFQLATSHPSQPPLHTHTSYLLEAHAL
jgi:hypothetical protein